MVTEQGLNVALPAERVIEELLGIGGHLRQHRLEINHQRPEQVDSHGADALHLRFAARFLGDFPRLFARNVLVGGISDGHDFAHSAAKFAVFIGVGDGVRCTHGLLPQFRLGNGV